MPQRDGRAPRLRGQINETSAAARTIVTLAPETCVKCVRPAARNSRLVKVTTIRVSPRAGPTTLAWSAGSTSRTAAADRWRTIMATARCTGPAQPNRPFAGRYRDRQVVTRRATIRARNWTGCRPSQLAEVQRSRENHYRPDISSSRSRSRRRNINRPPSDTGLSLG